MASMTMTASFLASNIATTATKQPRRGLIVAKASREEVNKATSNVDESSGRRELMFASVAAAACSMAKVAFADEPKAGTPDAKKKYGPICVTMPTARICHK
ncbi:hypothetical protein ACFE04_029016 [Oxalis oulophora]